jgi:hypothetical protein
MPMACRGLPRRAIFLRAAGLRHLGLRGLRQFVTRNLRSGFTVARVPDCSTGMHVLSETLFLVAIHAACYRRDEVLSRY